MKSSVFSIAMVLTFISSASQAAPLCSELFFNQTEITGTSPSLEAFGLKDVKIQRVWRSTVWEETGKEDFLDAWSKRHGNAPIPTDLRAEYYVSVLSEMNREPRVFYIRSKANDQVLQLIESFHSQLYRGTRGHTAHVNFVSKFELESLQQRLANGVPILMELVEKISTIDERALSKSVFLKIAKEVEEHMQQVMAAPWSRGDSKTETAKGIFKFSRQTKEVRASLTQLIESLK